LITLTKFTKKFCHTNPEIIFTRADKRNTTVANENTYIKKIEESLNYINTYTLVKKDPSYSIERKLNDTIKK